MWVRDIDDLQSIKYRLYGDYALSEDVQGSNISFIPLGNITMPFSGKLDGVGHKISNLQIHGEKKAAIFGLVIGTTYKKAIISDLALESISVTGLSYLSLLVAQGQFVDLYKISLKSSNNINGYSIIGGLIASGSAITIKDIDCQSPTIITGDEFFGQIAGALRNSELELHEMCNTECVGYII